MIDPTAVPERVLLLGNIMVPCDPSSINMHSQNIELLIWNPEVMIEVGRKYPHKTNKLHCYKAEPSTLQDLLDAGCFMSIKESRRRWQSFPIQGLSIPNIFLLKNPAHPVRWKCSKSRTWEHIHDLYLPSNLSADFSWTLLSYLRHTRTQHPLLFIDPSHREPPLHNFPRKQVNLAFQTDVYHKPIPLRDLNRVTPMSQPVNQSRDLWNSKFQNVLARMSLFWLKLIKMPPFIYLFKSVARMALFSVLRSNLTLRDEPKRYILRFVLQQY